MPVANPRAWPVPDPARTLRLIGDVHIGGTPPAAGNLPARYTKFADEALRTDTSKLVPQVAQTIQIGDQTENGLAGEVTLAVPWLARFGTPVLAKGNHDELNQTDAQWAAAYGQNVQSVTDTAFCRIITIHWNAIVSGVTTWVQTQISGTSLPCVLCVHFPMRDTVQAGTAPHDGFPSTTPYTYTIASGSDTNLRTLIDANPRLVCVVTGHTHSWNDAPGFFTLVNTGTRSFAHLNISALYYVGSTVAVFSAPIVGYYLTIVDPTHLELRARAHGAGVWVPPTGGTSKVAALTVT